MRLGLLHEEERQVVVRRLLQLQHHGRDVEQVGVAEARPEQIRRGEPGRRHVQPQRARQTSQRLRLMGYVDDAVADGLRD